MVGLLCKTEYVVVSEETSGDIGLLIREDDDPLDSFDKAFSSSCSLENKPTG